MGQIFVSYSHFDKAYVNKLVKNLKKRGFSFWVDDRLEYGSIWPIELQNRLDGCDALILVMTPRSLVSDWVQNELTRAVRKKKPIFPLLLEGSEPWLQVESTQIILVTGGRMPEEKFYERLSEVTSLNPRPDKKKLARFPEWARAKGKWILGFLLILAILVGSAAIIRSFAPFSTSPDTQTPAPTSAQRDWLVTFSVEFPPGTWSEGNHSYLYKATCPDPINSTDIYELTYTFDVSSSYPLFNAPVYIRRGGPHTQISGTEGMVDGINPSETTIAIYRPLLITYEDAQTAQAGCEVTISIDGKEPIPLIPGKIDPANNQPAQTRLPAPSNPTPDPAIIPNPIIILGRIVTVDVSGAGLYNDYSISVTNWNEFPAELFSAAPDLPACDLNQNASRTWVNFFNGADDGWIWGRCDFTDPSQLKLLDFVLKEDTATPISVYLVIWDRRTGVKYTSNVLVVKK